MCVCVCLSACLKRNVYPVSGGIYTIKRNFQPTRYLAYRIAGIRPYRYLSTNLARMSYAVFCFSRISGLIWYPLHPTNIFNLPLPLSPARIISHLFEDNIAKKWYIPPTTLSPNNGRDRKHSLFAIMKHSRSNHGNVLYALYWEEKYCMSKKSWHILFTL